MICIYIILYIYIHTRVYIYTLKEFIKMAHNLPQRLRASISGMLSMAPRDGMELRSAEGSTESKKTADHWESKSKENLPS